jgi:hypothetical protein
MGFVKVDPEQNRIVAVLLAVLLLALGATAYRMKATTAVTAAARQAPVAAEATANDTQDGFVRRTTRNPFKKPADMQAPVKSSGQGVPGTPLNATVSEIGAPLPPAHEGSWTLPVLPISPAVQEKSPTPQSDVQDTEQPTFTLMATVMSAGKSCAVLRIGDSQIKVVRVGDLVDGRFKLCALSSDRAELTDGIVKVVAKRGHTDNEQPKGP